jgi:hypothetical protein
MLETFGDDGDISFAGAFFGGRFLDRCLFGGRFFRGRLFGVRAAADQ